MNIHDGRRSFLDYQRLVRGLAPTSAKLYDHILAGFERAAGPNASLDRAGDRVEPFLAALARRGVGDHARRKTFDVVRQFYRWAAERGHARMNPLRDMRPPLVHARPRTFLTKAEAVHLLDATLRSGRMHSQRDAAILGTLFWAGLRIAEALSLKIHDFDVEESSLAVFGKGSRIRRVPVHQELARVLRRWLRVRPQGGDLLFPSQANGSTATGRLDNARIELMMREIYAPRAGLAGRATPHTLRRSFATELMRRKVQIGHIQQLLGHTDERTTRLYLNVSPEGLAESVGKL